MDVGVLSIVALVGLVAACGAARIARRRAARAAEQARARLRARRPSVPEVSANVRGLPAPPSDLWNSETSRRSR